MTELLTFTKFHTTQEGETLIQMLRDAKIEYTIEYERNPLDKIYTGESPDPMIAVKIPAADFEEVNALLLAHAKTQLTGIDPGYYMLHFTNEELLDVINNPDDWNHFDQALAQKLLSERNVPLPAGLPQKPGEGHYKPARLETQWLLAEYLLSITLMYAGIIIGLVTLFAFKTLKTGKKANLYDEATRTHAKIMLGLGVLKTGYELAKPFI